jgi:hypothetical protein
MKPLAIDLFCGLGGWTEGLIEVGYEVIGFDIEAHAYGVHRYPAQLVLQDVLTLQGTQFKDAALIVASPPCQAYSYRAMPWKRAKALPPPDNALFDACFRIQREAIAMAARFIPLVVENVRGAIPYVGRSRWNYGSFHLWGDVPALMPMTKAIKAAGIKKPGMNCGSDKPGYRAQAFNDLGAKGIGHAPKGHWTNPAEHGIKCGGDWFNSEQPSISRMTSSKSNARKRASAMIAKIPLPLARHIGRAWWPMENSDSRHAYAPGWPIGTHPLSMEGCHA